MDLIILMVSTGLYSGMLPVTPGIWGTATGLLLWYGCRNFTRPVYLGITAMLCIMGGLAAGAAELLLARPDAGPIVIDEIAGLFIALAFVPNRWFAWLTGFLAFIALDGLKPFPAAWIDTHVHGGLGIMLDDGVAGIYARLIVYFTHYVYARKK
ncbi:MAG: phosphatidylglycerophosphatase A [Desulfobacter sp.]